MAWVTLKAADYSPDMPTLNNPGSANVYNVLPRTPNSYGPMPSLNQFGTALRKQNQGALGVVDNLGNNYVFCGDANDLYSYTSASTSPSNVSKSSHVYNTPSYGQWDFSLFGQRVIATNYADAIQSYLINTDTAFRDLANQTVETITIVTQGNTYTNGTNYALTATGGGGSGFAGLVDVSGGHFTNARITNRGYDYTSTPTIVLPSGAGSGDSTASIILTVQSTVAPKAKYVCVTKGFLVLANTNDGVSGNQPQRVWWSANNDPTNWPTPGTAAAAIVQSSYNDLYGEGGLITGIVGNLGGADLAVFMQHAVWRGVYAGPPAVFDFFPAEGVRGTFAPNSIVHLGMYAYYLGEDGFYVFDGSNSKPIGANRVDKTFYANVDLNHMQNVRGSADPFNKIIYWIYPSKSASNGIPNSCLAYNWQIDKWSNGMFTAENMFQMYSLGYTLDTMPGTLDSLTYALDDPFWTNGNAVLAGFDSSHSLGFFNGSSLAAIIETSEVSPFDEQLAWITNTRPIIDGSSPSVAIATRNRNIDIATYGTSYSMNSIGTCPLTANGRYVRAQITIPAASSWTHFQGIEIDAVPNGVR